IQPCPPVPEQYGFPAPSASPGGAPADYAIPPTAAARSQRPCPQIPIRSASRSRAFRRAHGDKSIPLQFRRKAPANDAKEPFMEVSDPPLLASTWPRCPTPSPIRQTPCVLRSSFASKRLLSTSSLTV